MNSSRWTARFAAGVSALALAVAACSPAAPASTGASQGAPPTQAPAPKPTTAPAAAPTTAPAAATAAAKPAGTTAPAATSAPAPAAATGVQGALDSLAQHSGADRQTFLEQQAMKEGKVVFYSSADPDVLKGWNDLFKAKYPQLDVQFVRMTTADMLQKSEAESRAGKPVADLLNPPAAELAILEKDSMLARYASPQSANFDKIFADPNGYWTDAWYVPEVVGFNTDVVSEDQVPKTLEALTSPALKGKLGRTTLGDRWVAGVLQAKGQDAGMKLLQQIAEMQPRMYDSNTSLGNALGSGQIGVAFDIHVNNVTKLTKDGAPVKYVVPEPLFVFAQYLSIPKDAPHPYAAALAYDWILSKDGGQSIYPEHDHMGPRKDMQYPFGDVLSSAKTVISYSPELLPPDKLPAYQKTFQDLFVRQ